MIAGRALAAWSDEPNKNFTFSYDGTTSAGVVEDGQNSIVYNSSTGVPAGAIGYAQFYANAQHVYKGETFYSMSEGDVVMKAGLAISADAFEEAVTHEVGHTIGFRHSNQGTPSTSAAIMNSSVSGAYGSTLQPWDIDAVTHVYTVAASTPTAVVFTDDPLVAGVTRIKAVHLAELRQAVNNVRARAGLGAASFTDAAVPGVVVKAIHILELRTALDAARSILGLPTGGYTDASLTGVRVKAVHFQELRDRAKQ